MSQKERDATEGVIASSDLERLHALVDRAHALANAVHEGVLRRAKHRRELSEEDRELLRELNELVAVQARFAMLADRVNAAFELDRDNVIRISPKQRKTLKAGGQGGGDR